MIEVILKAEMENHLGYSKYDYSNKNTENSRNGYNEKTLRGKKGSFRIRVPRDRKSEFEPKIVKWKKDISGVEDMIISLYAKGMSTRDISRHLEEIYNHEISPSEISNIVERVKETAIEWQNRPLKEIYAIIFFDGIFYKVKEEGEVKEKAVYIALGIGIEGEKEVIGVWIMENESSKGWLGVLNELKNRGVKEVLIFSIDGLPGLSSAISSVYPKSEIQRCLVHQIRNSLRYASYKDRKEMAKDLKEIYKAPTEEMGKLGLDRFEDKWGKKYPYVVKSWRDNWEELSTLFKYPEEIRRLIYTTNPIESLNNQIKKLTKTKGVYSSEEALFKSLYLSIKEATKRWTGKTYNWAPILSQLSIYFEDILEKYL